MLTAENQKIEKDKYNVFKAMRQEGVVSSLDHLLSTDDGGGVWNAYLDQYGIREVFERFCTKEGYFNYKDANFGDPKNKIPKLADVKSERVGNSDQCVETLQFKGKNIKNDDQLKSVVFKHGGKETMTVEVETDKKKISIKKSYSNDGFTAFEETKGKDAGTLKLATTSEGALRHYHYEKSGTKESMFVNDSLYNQSYVNLGKKIIAIKGNTGTYKVRTVKEDVEITKSFDSANASAFILDLTPATLRHIGFDVVDAHDILAYTKKKKIEGPFEYSVQSGDVTCEKLTAFGKNVFEKNSAPDGSYTTKIGKLVKYHSAQTGLTKEMHQHYGNQVVVAYNQQNKVTSFTLEKMEEGIEAKGKQKTYVPVFKNGQLDYLKPSGKKATFWNTKNRLSFSHIAAGKVLKSLAARGLKVDGYMPKQQKKTLQSTQLVTLSHMGVVFLVPYAVANDDGLSAHEADLKNDGVVEGVASNPTRGREGRVF